MANLRPGADEPGIGFDFEGEVERHRLSHPAKLDSSAEEQRQASTSKKKQTTDDFNLEPKRDQTTSHLKSLK